MWLGIKRYIKNFNIPENQSTTRQSDYDRVLEVSEPNAVKGQGAG